MKRRAPIALRVNPEVERAGTSTFPRARARTNSASAMDRAREVYAAAAKMEHIRIRGVQIHIGSQITKAAPFAAAVKKMAPLVAELKALYGIEFFSVGGGLGIVYKSSLESGPGDVVARGRRAGAHGGGIRRGDRARCEGAGVAHPAGAGAVHGGQRRGIPYARAVPQAHASGKKFVIVDAGMNDLIRPALYQGYHEMVPLREPAGERSARGGGRGRAGVRERGFLCASARVAAAASGGPRGVDERGGVWVRDGVELQLAAVAGGGPGGRKGAAVVRDRQTLEDIIRGEHIPGKAS